MSSSINQTSIQRISFNELVSGSEGVRYTDVNSVPYMSVRDIIMVVCGQNNDRAGKTWRNIDEDKKIELRQSLANFQFEGRGQSEQPVITLQGALKLIMWLPGTMAKDFRSQACDILTRYLAGDQSLHDEVNANAQSHQPINEFARASLPESNNNAQLATANAQLVTMNTQLVANAAQLIAANDRATTALVTQGEQLGGVLAQLSTANANANAATEKERHLRHQADGRYGSGIREVTKEVREQNNDLKKRMEIAENELREERRERKIERREAEKAQREMLLMMVDNHSQAADDRRQAAEDRRLFLAALERRDASQTI